MKKNIFYSESNGLMSIQEAMAHGYDVKVTSPPAVLQALGLERLVQMELPETDIFHYIEEGAPIRKENGTLHRNYQVVGYFDHLEEDEANLQRNQILYNLDMERCEMEIAQACSEFQEAIDLGFMDEKSGRVFDFSAHSLNERQGVLFTSDKTEPIVFCDKAMEVVELSFEEASRIAFACKKFYTDLCKKRSDTLADIRKSKMASPSVVDPVIQPAPLPPTDS
jgi:hypothetical protein